MHASTRTGNDNRPCKLRAGNHDATVEQYAAPCAGGNAGILQMVAKTVKVLKWAAVLVGVSLLSVLALRAYDSQRGPPLELWHTHVPHELKAAEIDKADWKSYLASEQSLFDDVRKEVTEKLDPEVRVSSNRYFDGSPIYPPKFQHDWNRSYIMEPDGPPVGAVVLLHGLTDSPYSLRHIARRYRDDGFVAIAIRLPGHGTVPAGLSAVAWEDWSAATRLAVREARRRIGPTLPLHMIGFSNGGALAMKYALDGLGDKTLSRPDRIVLISPMIGITSLARFAGVFGWPAVFPAFAKAAWLGIVPEFNPFKYNSFPVNAARQSSLAARALQQQIAQYATAGRLVELPPILTFQSVVDFTVSTRAIINALYANLPANGSELVLFDLNRNAKFGPLLRSSTDTILARLLPRTTAHLQDHDHHQRRCQQQRSRRARHRCRRHDGTDAYARPATIRPKSSRSRISRCRFR